jgi:hypothetical protein
MGHPARSDRPQRWRGVSSAQSLNLEQILAGANVHLERLRPRYRLVQVLDEGAPLGSAMARRYQERDAAMTDEQLAKVAAMMGLAKSTSALQGP